MPEIPTEFVTYQSLGSLSASAGVVIPVAGLIQKLTGIRTPIWGLLLSILISCGVVFHDGGIGSFWDWLLAVLNGCLIFCTAAGILEFGIAASEQTSSTKTVTFSRKRESIKLFSSWFRDQDLSDID